MSAAAPVALVVGAGSPAARAIQLDLEAHGWAVAVVGGPGVPLDTPEAVAVAFDAARPLGPPRLVVHVDVPPAACRPGPLVELDDDGWDAGCEAVVRSTLLVFQAAHQVMGEGGAIVLVNPSIALAGAAGLVAWSAAAEAQRIMAKVAARRWGARGITVNVVSVAPAVLCDDPAPALAATGQTKRSVALGDEAASPEAVAGVVRMLAGPDARALTGATLVADGGRLMVP